MWLIAGLGNPGKKYARTRHNIGFMVAEEIAQRYGIDFRERRECKMGRGSIEGQTAVLIEPLLYMNASGLVIREIFRKLPVGPETLIVLYDNHDMRRAKYASGKQVRHADTGVLNRLSRISVQKILSDSRLALAEERVSLQRIMS